jgi:hypothetical protein
MAAIASRIAARPQSCAAGQADAMAILMRRTLTRTSAPILSSLRRMVPQVAFMSGDPCRPQAQGFGDSDAPIGVRNAGFRSGTILSEGIGSRKKSPAGRRGQRLDQQAGARDTQAPPVDVREPARPNCGGPRPGLCPSSVPNRAPVCGVDPSVTTRPCSVRCGKPRPVASPGGSGRLFDPSQRAFL